MLKEVGEITIHSKLLREEKLIEMFKQSKYFTLILKSQGMFENKYTIAEKVNEE